MSTVRDKHKTLTIAAKATTAIVAAGTASTTFTLNGTQVVGGVVTFDPPRHVLISAVGNESGHTFTITGRGRDGGVLTETITGPNATTATSTLNFAAVTEVTQSATNAAAVDIGTSDTLETGWIPLDYRNFHTVTIAVDITATGTLGYRVDKTWEDPAVITPTNENTIFSSTVTASGTVDTATSLIDQTVTCVRIAMVQNTSTANATIRYHIIQS